MIPSDVVSRLQLVSDAAVTRPPSVQQVVEALGELVPGQRILAEIQALLPTGAYRALINQREVTLALPFAAKAGDSLELEVVENEGKLILAALSRPPGRVGEGSTQQQTPPAVETTLSRTGSFIASLAGSQDEPSSAEPAPLNARQPVSPTPPQKGSELVPLLKQAIGNSGMFYESHQSQWVGAQRPLESLLAEPQGQQSPRLQYPEAFPAAPRFLPQAAEFTEAGRTAPPPASAAPDHGSRATDTTAETAPRSSQSPADLFTQQAMQKPAPNASEGAVSSPTQSVANERAMVATPPAASANTPLVAPDLTAIVQQQLEALATQNYVWQGLAWPGQAMRWEIDEDSGQRANADENAAPSWQTRLVLSMPSLGEVRAALRLSGGEVALTLSSVSDASVERLSGNSLDLRTQLQSAGLTVSSLTVERHGGPE